MCADLAGCTIVQIQFVDYNQITDQRFSYFLEQNPQFDLEVATVTTTLYCSFLVFDVSLR